mmetsp:Transcript_9588/g.10944  ORF Transcript_9588/g.10944 Transcript_9588/m.10944 type:complete len:639 (-) Transcript_9588:109-2025(-)
MTTRTLRHFHSSLSRTRALTQASCLYSRSRKSLVNSNACSSFGAERLNPFRFQQHCLKSTSAQDYDKDEKKNTPPRVRTKPFLLDLGIPSLVPEWKKMFNPKTILSDVSAGLTVGCIAVPLSLAIAMASGVPAEVGLATAAVSGVAGGLLGGTTLAVTGPAAAISLLVIGAVQQHGLEALPFITIGVGALQLATGVTRLGVYAKLVPVSVIAGFTTGVGTLILSGQIPKALGMTAPAGLNPLEMLGYLGSHMGDMNPASAALAFGTAGAMYGLPKIHAKIPAALLAVGGATVATHTLGLDVALIGTLPSGMSAFQFSIPSVPAMGEMPSLVATTLLIYTMTSVESLLSCVALEKMKKTDYKHNSDQELVGQGLANVGAGLFMGMPVTSVIARSGLNVRAGAQTRLPSLIQSGFVFGSIAFASSTISMIPMPALSGMLISTGCNMLYPSEFNYCYSIDKTTTVPFFTTVAGMLSMGLTEGIGIGCATALGLAIHKNMVVQVRMKAVKHTGAEAFGNIETEVIPPIESQPPCKDALVINPTDKVWLIEGPVNFISMFEIENMVEDLRERCNPKAPIVLDMRNVTSLDFTGMEELATKLIESEDDFPSINMITSRPEVIKIMKKVDKDMHIKLYPSIALSE